MPDGPQTTRFSWRPTHSRVRSAAWVGAGIEDRRVVPGVEGLPGREGGPGPPGGQGGAVPAGDFLGEQDPQDLGRFPPLGPGGGEDLGGARRICGSRIRRSSCFEVVGQRRRGRGAGGHRATSWPSERGPAAGALGQGLGLAGSCDRAGCGPRPGGPGWRPGHARRTGPRTAACPRARSTSAAGCSAGQLDGAGHLGPDPAGPAAAASASHSPAPSPMARNSASACVRARGVRSSGPCRRGRVVGVVDAGAARRGDRVAGDLGRAAAAGVDDHDLARRGGGPTPACPASRCGHRVPAALERAPSPGHPPCGSPRARR